MSMDTKPPAKSAGGGPKVAEKPLSDLKPYENNPRRIGDDAIAAVAESIRQFGFRVPIVIDADGVIVCGHTRYQAAQSLGLASVPCIVADDLTEEQIKAYRLADNRTSELSAWDFSALEAELDALSGAFDMGAFGFDFDSDAGNDAEAEAERIQTIDSGGEIDTGEYSDERFNCQCPKCGFRFNV